MPCPYGIEHLEKLQVHTTDERFCDDVWRPRYKTQGILHGQICSALLQTQPRTDSTPEA